MKILVSGGAGFIGSALVRFLIEHTSAVVINVDKLTYAGNLSALSSVSNHERYHFVHIDICATQEMRRIFELYQPDAVMHLAAESHVDRSITDPFAFIQTNIIGTYTLLQTALSYWHTLSDPQKKQFRFHHISTDEVYGDLKNSHDLFSETTAYDPSSPYSASKASSDHLVRAWHKTYNLPILITNCSNNYGPYQFPEKLIPRMIHNAISGKPLTVYGNGKQIRDWLYVDDHVRALYLVLTKGNVGETYNIGGHNEKENLEVIHQICRSIQTFIPAESIGLRSYTDLITFVQDRAGHDQRYAIDARKIKHDLNWFPQETFDSGIQKTVEWYMTHPTFKKDSLAKTTFIHAT